MKNLKGLIAILNESKEYRIIQKYQKPQYYNIEDCSNKLIGVFLDIEATGLSYTKDKIIELGMVKFEYNEGGQIFRLLDEFNEYQDPEMPISESISQLTGITNATVKGHKIDVKKVKSYLNDVNIIIAHNAQFDRNFFEMTFPSIIPKPWACLMYDIDWKNEGILSHKLEYIAYRYSFFFEEHRAVNDCLAGIHILAQKLLISKQPVLKKLLTNSEALRFRLWATNSCYDKKELLKSRGYKWNNANRYRAWSIEVTEAKVIEEIEYLKSEIYGGPINIPIEAFDARSRFLNNGELFQNNLKYRDKIDWVRLLCEK